VRGGVITGSGRTAAAISAATHCLEQYNSGDVVSPSMCLATLVVTWPADLSPRFDGASPVVVS
jgi:hypothetical protein